MISHKLKHKLELYEVRFHYFEIVLTTCKVFRFTGKLLCKFREYSKFALGQCAKSA